ncbi:MAG TPA: Gfo/Idh/MocA family oxidoreductase [Armatimonadota bacterium]|jgi:predicted dehydrogenase
MDKVRLGIIGCGVIGPVHAGVAAQLPTVELVAVADLIEEKRNAIAAKYGVPKVYEQGEELLNDPEIDAVILAVPYGARRELPFQALDAGKHVLIEKPAADSVRTITALIDARGDRVVACCSSRYQANPSTQVATQFVASGALGPLRAVYCRAYNPAGAPPASPPPAWRQSFALNAGGILVNWGCYDLDYLLSITGWTLRPRVVLAQTWPVPAKYASYVAPGSDADSHFSAFIRCDDGTVITFERGEYMPAARTAAWQLVGENGSLTLALQVSGPKALIFDEANSATGTTSRTIWEGEEDFSLVNQGPLENFAEVILHGGEPRTSLERARYIQQITDAIYASAIGGTAMTIKG